MNTGLLFGDIVMSAAPPFDAAFAAGSTGSTVSGSACGDLSMIGVEGLGASATCFASGDGEIFGTGGGGSNSGNADSGASSLDAFGMLTSICVFAISNLAFCSGPATSSGRMRINRSAATVADAPNARRCFIGLRRTGSARRLVGEHEFHVLGKRVQSIAPLARRHGGNVHDRGLAFGRVGWR